MASIGRAGETFGYATFGSDPAAALLSSEARSGRVWRMRFNMGGPVQIGIGPSGKRFVPGAGRIRCVVIPGHKPCQFPSIGCRLPRGNHILRLGWLVAPFAVPIVPRYRAGATAIVSAPTIQKSNMPGTEALCKEGPLGAFSLVNRLGHRYSPRSNLEPSSALVRYEDL